MKLSLSEEASLPNNPFTTPLKGINQLDIKVTKVLYNIVSYNGSTSEGYYFQHRCAKTKLYHNTGCFDVVCKMTPCAKDLFLYIAYMLDSGKDYIYIDVKHFVKAHNLKTDRTFRNAVKELITLQVIDDYQYLKHFYWINPMFMFNGDLLQKYNDKIEKGKHNVWDKRKIK